MSVQVVAAKMAEVELKDVPTGKDLPAESPMTPTSEGKTLARNDPHEAGFSAAASLAAEPSSAKAGEGSPGLLTPNPPKMPQASAMKRTDPQQNGGEAFVNRDGTVAEAPRMKKMFFEEQLHLDDEIRNILDGRAYADVRDKEDRWIRIAMSKGEMITD
eukprot:superscaffoldBa00000464_g4912